MQAVSARVSTSQHGCRFSYTWASFIGSLTAPSSPPQRLETPASLAKLLSTPGPPDYAHLLNLPCPPLGNCRSS